MQGEMEHDARPMKPHRMAALALALLAPIACGKKDDAPPPAPTAAAAPSAATSADSIPALDMGGPKQQPAGIPAPDDVAAPPADATKTASGLASKVLAKGTGKDHPTPQDKVKVNYTGWTKDGKMFDSSITRGEPATFGVGQV